jgi:hypothetical protein
MADSDADLIDDLLFCSQLQTSKVRARRYIRPGTQRERDARAALARLLCSKQQLTDPIRFALGVLLDPRQNTRPYGLVLRNLKGGRQLSGLEDAIASHIAKRRIAGVLHKIAVQEAIEKYGVSQSTVDRAWRHIGDFWLYKLSPAD